MELVRKHRNREKVFILISVQLANTKLSRTRLSTAVAAGQIVNHDDDQRRLTRPILLAPRILESLSQLAQRGDLIKPQSRGDCRRGC